MWSNFHVLLQDDKYKRRKKETMKGINYQKKQRKAAKKQWRKMYKQEKQEVINNLYRRLSETCEYMPLKERLIHEIIGE